MDCEWSGRKMGWPGGVVDTVSHNVPFIIEV